LDLWQGPISLSHQWDKLTSTNHNSNAQVLPKEQHVSCPRVSVCLSVCWCCVSPEALSIVNRAKYAIEPWHVCSKTTLASLILHTSNLWLVTELYVDIVLTYTSLALIFQALWSYLDSGLVFCLFRYRSIVIWWQKVNVRQPSWLKPPEVGNSSRVL